MKGFLARRTWFSILANPDAPQHSSNKFDSALGFQGFSSGWVEISQEIDGVAGGFYLGACTQGKERRHNIRDEVST